MDGGRRAPVAVYLHGGAIPVSGKIGEHVDGVRAAEGVSGSSMAPSEPHRGGLGCAVAAGRRGGGCGGGGGEGLCARRRFCATRRRTALWWLAVQFRQPDGVLGKNGLRVFFLSANLQSVELPRAEPQPGAIYLDPFCPGW